MSVVLITGSSGLVGSESVNFFCKKGFEVIGIDNNLRKFFFGTEGSTLWVRNSLLKKNKEFKSLNVDIRNYEKLSKIFKKYQKKISLIIHCAAQPSHDYGKNFPKIDFDVNASGTLNLLELTRKFCSKSPFIFMSTNKVYGDNPNKIKLKSINGRYYPKNKNHYAKGFNEELSTDKCLHSFFGTSKLYADIIVQEYGKNFNLNTVCF